MSSYNLVRERVQTWQIVVSATVSAYLALGAATHSIRGYHWGMLLAIPAAFWAWQRGRQFFLDWAPLFAFWMVYDRLRLVQPFLLDRVAVKTPYLIELWAFGWLAGGHVPAHAARAWLAAHSSAPVWAAAGWAAQLIYLSHVAILPLLFFPWWWKGRRDEAYRNRFSLHMRAFLALHILGICIYLLLPVAPPWWVGLYGTAQPSAELLAQTNMSAAMDGVIVQRLIQNASQWFAAVPSLHGAYPVLLLLLSLKDRSRLVISLLTVYAAAMWVATVVLNQHYIVDLLAGAAIAVLAWWIGLNGVTFFRNKPRKEVRDPQLPGAVRRS